MYNSKYIKMKQLIKTKFFLALKEASEKDIEVDTRVILESYEKFAMLLLSEGSACTDESAYRNMLVYTRAELSGIAKRLQKKILIDCIEKSIMLIDSQIEWIQEQILWMKSTRSCPYMSNIENRKTLKWMSNPMDLVELLYALHEAGCIEKIFLKDLFLLAGKLFDCEINNFTSLYWKIRNRIKGDRTSFLDKLKRTLMRKMEKEDEKPSRK